MSETKKENGEDSLADRALPRTEIQAATASGPSPTLTAAPQAVKRSMPMGLSVLIGITGALFFSWFFSKLAWFLLLIYLSFLFATILDAPVAWLRCKGVKRGVSTAVLMFAAVALVVAIIYFAATHLYGQFQELAKNLQDLPDKVNAFVDHFRRTHPGLAYSLKDFDAKKMWGTVLSPTALQNAAFGILQNAPAMLDILTSIVVMFFVTMYMCIDGPDYLKSSRRLLPKSVRLETTRVFEEACKAHRGWFVANLANVCSASVLTSTGLWLCGVPGAPILGTIAGLGELVPNIGPGIGAIPSLLITLVAMPHGFLYVVAMFVVVQTIQSYGISPLVMKHGVELPPLVIIIAVLVMGTLFGVLGVLVAIPLTADLLVLWNYFNAMYAKDAADNDFVNAPAAESRVAAGPALPRDKILAGVDPTPPPGDGRRIGVDGSDGNTGKESLRPGIDSAVSLRKKSLLERVRRFRPR